MAKTISTHNGSAAHRAHNIRDPRATGSQPHIDPKLKSNNETLVDEAPRAAYKRIFGDALAAYNQKQKRDDRKIRDYYTHISQDAKKHPVYEMIVQIGGRSDTGLDAPVERECIKEFVAGWPQRNPNLELIGAYIHADETDGTLHAHLDYIPVATGYKRGLERQSSLAKALEQQGCGRDERHSTAQIRWEARENAALEAICEAHGIEVEHPQRDRQQHLDVATYKAQAALQEVQAELTAARDDLEEVEDLIQRAESELSDQLDAAQDASHMADEALDQAQAAQTRLRTAETAATKLDIRIQELQPRVEVLERDVATLETRKEDLQTEIQDAQDRAHEAEATVTTLDTRIQELQPRADALADDVATLEARREDLRTEIQDAQEELQVLDRALQRRRDEGQAAFGADLQERINAARQQQAKEARLKSLETFVAHPQVQPLWERFQQLQKASQRKKKAKELSRD